MKNIVVILSVLAFLTACGPSKVEIEKRKQFVADSIAEVERKAEEKRIHEEKIEVGKRITKNKLETIIGEIDQQLKREKSELSEIKEFQLLRSSSTKRSQIRNQNEVIQELKQFRSRVEHEIAMSNLHESYDFQSSPQGTIEYLFSAAKNRDFSKVRHLRDPYGEYSNSALEVCLIEMQLKEAQDAWIRLFEKGRIMGEPVVNDTKAEIEIATGMSSNKLRKVQLIRRLDKWYLQNF